MPHDFFDDIANPSITLGSKKRYTVSVSLVVHTAITAAVLIIPLVATDVLPTPRGMAVFVSAPPMPLAPPSAPLKSIRKPTLQDSASVAPVVAPSTITPETADTEPTAGTASAIGNVVAGVTDGISGAVVEPLAPPPPPPSASAPVPVGGDIKPPMKIKDARPIYPAIAQSAHVQGVVIVEAVIGPQGTVKEARVLRSIPLLDQAALDAVRQWQFTPTLLNGVAVSVIMNVTVNFTLR